MSLPPGPPDPWNPEPGPPSSWPPSAPDPAGRGFPKKPPPAGPEGWGPILPPAFGMPSVDPFAGWRTVRAGLLVLRIGLVIFLAGALPLVSGIVVGIIGVTSWFGSVFRGGGGAGSGDLLAGAAVLCCVGSLVGIGGAVTALVGQWMCVAVPGQSDAKPAAIVSAVAWSGNLLFYCAAASIGSHMDESALVVSFAAPIPTIAGSIAFAVFAMRLETHLEGPPMLSPKILLGASIASLAAAWGSTALGAAAGTAGAAEVGIAAVVLWYAMFVCVAIVATTARNRIGLAGSTPAYRVTATR